ncbi:MAG: hypothetical protein ACI4PG_06745 [Candidatus Ventricola sp.]
MPAGSPTFGSLVKSYMLAHHLSYQDIADTLGYKSKTSVSRIIQDETSYELRVQFFRRFAECYPMSRAEQQLFLDTLELSRYSSRSQQYFAAYQELLRAGSAEKPLVSISPGDALAAFLEPFSQAIERHAGQARSIELSIFGLLPAKLLGGLFDLLQPCGCAFTIRHYLFGAQDGLTSLQAITSSWPLLFDPHYEPMVCSAGESSAQFSRHILLHFDLPDGDGMEAFFLLMDDSRPLYCELPGGAISSLYHDFFFRGKDVIRPLKTDYPAQPPCPRVQAFVQLQQDIASAEAGCAVYALRKSPTIELIPPDIFRSALILPPVFNQDAQRCYTELLRLQKKRHTALLRSRNPLHCIFSADAFQHFAQTGCLIDHPAFLRPFSPKERYEILSFVLTQMESNPYFSFLLAGDALTPFLNTFCVTCFAHLQRSSARLSGDSDCLMLQPIEGGSAIFLRDSESAASFSRFFLDHICARHVRSARVTRKTLRALLEYLSSRLP